MTLPNPYQRPPLTGLEFYGEPARGNVDDENYQQDGAAHTEGRVGAHRRVGQPAQVNPQYDRRRR